MNRYSLRTLILISLLAFLGIFYQTKAADVGTISFVSAATKTCNITGNSVTVQYSLSIHLPAGQYQDYVNSEGSTNDRTGPFDYTGTWDSGTFALDGNTQYWAKSTIYKGANASTGVQIGIYVLFDCSGKADGQDADVSYSYFGVTSSGGSSGDAGFNPNDGRINLQGYATVAIYCQTDRVAMYGIDAAGHGYPAIFIAYDDLPAASPDGNILITTFENIRFYRLTTGEFQVNVGPDAEGKDYVFVWDDCPPTYTEAFIFQNGVSTASG